MAQGIESITAEKKKGVKNAASSVHDHSPTDVIACAGQPPESCAVAQIPMDHQLDVLAPFLPAEAAATAVQISQDADPTCLELERGRGGPPPTRTQFLLSACKVWYICFSGVWYVYIYTMCCCELRVVSAARC